MIGFRETKGYNDRNQLKLDVRECRDRELSERVGSNEKFMCFGEKSNRFSLIAKWAYEVQIEERYELSLI